MKIIGQSELIINNDGSIFHLHLKPEHIADTILLVGDPGRVDLVSSFFDEVEFKIQNREFITHTGYYNNKRFSVIATGIGTDNIDIVINELDALVNIDLGSRQSKQKHKILNFIRIGTSGGLQEDLDINRFLLSEMSIGFDGLLNFYKDRNSVCEIDLEKSFMEFVSWNSLKANPYVVKSSDLLNNVLGEEMNKGITISAPGFYGPQGRVLRLNIEDSELNNKIRKFRFKGHRITNYEMESSALFGLSKLLGHNAACICVIIANRYSKQYSKDYKPAIKSLIKLVLDRLSKS